MRLILEETNRNEVDRIRLLFESKGIPVNIGNEDTARNFNFIALEQKYGIWVIEDDQYNCAKALLEDENYEVKNPIDLAEYYRLIQDNPVSLYRFMVVKIFLPMLLLAVGIFIILFVAL